MAVLLLLLWCMVVTVAHACLDTCWLGLPPCTALNTILPFCCLLFGCTHILHIVNWLGLLHFKDLAR